MTTKRLSKADHLELAKHIQAIRRLTAEVRYATAAMPKSGRVGVALRRHEAAFSRLRCALDSEWHAVINEADFKEHGHVYFSNAPGP